jgi:hypothetical protein
MGPGMQLPLIETTEKGAGRPPDIVPTTGSVMLAKISGEVAGLPGDRKLDVRSSRQDAGYPGGDNAVLRNLEHPVA